MVDGPAGEREVVPLARKQPEPTWGTCKKIGRSTATNLVDGGTNKKRGKFKEERNQR